MTNETSEYLQPAQRLQDQPRPLLTKTLMGNVVVCSHSFAKQLFEDVRLLCRQWGKIGVMKTRKRLLREEHPDTLISIANLASTHRN